MQAVAKFLQNPKARALLSDKNADLQELLKTAMKLKNEG